jgi:hypothetical protein
MTKIDEQIKKREDDMANELWTGLRPSAAQCKKCIHAYPNTQYTVGAEKANCFMFEPAPNDKPAGVLTDEVTCPYFEKK